MPNDPLITVTLSNGVQVEAALDEYAVRQWFRKVTLDEAIDTHRVVMGIIEARMDFRPQRKRRKDAGRPRDDGNMPLIGNLGGIE
jgi:hypothetical protein